MKIKLTHPLWTHLPALAALVLLIIRLIMSKIPTGTVAIHFNSQGLPNGYGSAWFSFGLAIGLSVLFIGISIIISEIWAREEKKKTFNWISLFDDVTVGFLVSVNLGYLDYLNTGATTFVFPWQNVLLITGGATVLAVLLELLRPFRSNSRLVAVTDTTAVEKEVEQRLKRGETFVYWQSQNPLYLSIVFTLIPLVFLTIAILVWATIPWMTIEFVVIGLAMTILYGGIRTMVNREYLTVRFGIFGIRVLRIPITNIKEVNVHEFSAFRDFGGMGIRSNGQMKAYFLRGSRGVKITTLNDKQYLIGSDHPDELNAVLKAVVKTSKKTEIPKTK
jgi:hypothetical protein